MRSSPHVFCSSSRTQSFTTSNQSVLFKYIQMILKWFHCKMKMFFNIVYNLVPHSIKKIILILYLIISKDVVMMQSELMMMFLLLPSSCFLGRHRFRRGGPADVPDRQDNRPHAAHTHAHTLPTGAHVW